MTTSAPTARSIAAKVLLRVDKDQAFAAAALDAELLRHVQLGARDRALATELLYGVLRLRPWLESRLAGHAPRGLKTKDAELMGPLLVSAYELTVLERVPAFASVNEAVSTLRARRGERVSGFANALLRKLAAEGKADAQTLDRAAWESAPAWLRASLARTLGEDGARAFVADTRHAPPLGLRVDHGDREAIRTLLEDAATNATREDGDTAASRAKFTLGRVSPRAILATGAGSVQKLLASMPGLVVQEEGAQVVGLSLGVRAGDRVLDACAGRGNKTGLFADQAGPRGAVDASDVHPQKLDRLREELAKIGRAPRATFAADLSRGTGTIKGPYDRIMVDAPCSGTGTLRRRPDIFRARAEESIVELAALQANIVHSASKLLAPGGRLVFAVCSVLREEAEDVVQAVLARDESLELVPFDTPLDVARGSTQLRLTPAVHGTDGYFMASFGKRTADDANQRKNEK